MFCAASSDDAAKNVSNLANLIGNLLAVGVYYFCLNWDNNKEAESQP